MDYGERNAAVGGPHTPTNVTATYYHWDHLGSVRLATDQNHQVVAQHDFEPFGVIIGPSMNQPGNTHLYTGHERDTNSGLDYMHFRYYGSNMGRFMKPDIIAGKPGDPKSWNLYAYVLGNPMNLVDPNGKDPLPPTSYGSGFFGPLEQIWANKAALSKNLTHDAAKSVSHATRGIENTGYGIAVAGIAVDPELIPIGLATAKGADTIKTVADLTAAAISHSPEDVAAVEGDVVDLLTTLVVKGDLVRLAKAAGPALKGLAETVGGVLGNVVGDASEGLVSPPPPPERKPGKGKGNYEPLPTKVEPSVNTNPTQ